MADGDPRDLSAAAAPIKAWLAGQLAAEGLVATDVAVELRSHTGGGYSNEIILVDATFRVGRDLARRRLVIRLPPVGAALFPDYDLAMQVAVQEAVGAHGVPVPAPIVHESDERWLGAAFLAMPRVEGHDPGELPVVDPWVASATPAQQRAMHQAFLDTLARIHTTPWHDQPVASRLRGADSSIDEEIRWWEDLLAWSFDGEPPEAMTSAFAWCRARRPPVEPPASILWGDVRLGNVIFDDDRRPAAVLDWEMASIGPPEMDVAWYTALEAMTEHFFGQRVAGFATREEIVAGHERALGRPLVDLAWFEIFAMCRSATLNIRADRLTSLRLGKPPRPAEANAVLTYALDAIAAFDSTLGESETDSVS